MNDFTYYTPTKVVFANDAELQTGKLLKEYNAKRVLIHYGSNSAKSSGLLDRVIDSIKKENIEYVLLGGVIPNPLLSKVYEGIELCKKENIDFILAVGGGSTIDSAKAIAIGLAHNNDVWDFFEGKAIPTKSYPVATVLTIPAAGSEMSDSCVITKDEGKLKRYTGNKECICKFAIMNPKLTLTLPSYQTASGCVDILMHTMERYFNNSTNLNITDKISEAIMQSVIINAKILHKDPQNINARNNIMWAGSLSHNSLTGCGTNGGDWSTHDIEHELGGMYDVTHGAGLAAVWGSWARYVSNIIPERFIMFATNVFNIAYTTQEETINNGIEAMEDFYQTINMPISLTDLGINPTKEEIEEMAEKGSHFGKKLIGSVKPLNKQDIINILTNAK